MWKCVEGIEQPTGVTFWVLGVRLESSCLVASVFWAVSPGLWAGYSKTILLGKKEIFLSPTLLYKQANPKGNIKDAAAP